MCVVQCFKKARWRQKAITCRIQKSIWTHTQGALIKLMTTFHGPAWEEVFLWRRAFKPTCSTRVKVQAALCCPRLSLLTSCSSCFEALSSLQISDPEQGKFHLLSPEARICPPGSCWAVCPDTEHAERQGSLRPLHPWAQRAQWDERETLMGVSWSPFCVFGFFHSSPSVINFLQHMNPDSCFWH